MQIKFHIFLIQKITGKRRQFINMYKKQQMVMVIYFPNTWLVKKHHTVDLCAAFFTIVGCWSTIWAVNDVHCLLATKTTFPC